MLRERSGDFVRDLMSESGGFDGEPAALGEMRFARCSRDSCVADIGAAAAAGGCSPPASRSGSTGGR